MKKLIVFVIASLIPLCSATAASELSVTPNQTLERHGLTVIAAQMHFNPVFHDEKNAGIQIILHDQRVATDGTIRLGATPEQWDPVPQFIRREGGPETGQITVTSAYADRSLKFHLVVTPEDGGFRVAVNLDEPLPEDLVGKVGFNLDFLPTRYFGKAYIMDDATRLFPRSPTGPMAGDDANHPVPLAAGGHSIVLSPGDPLTYVSITSNDAPLSLYDARDRAQNGWFVVRSPIPAGKTTNALVWHISTQVIKGWARDPVVSFNQAGYTPERSKVAIVELDPRMDAPRTIKLLKIGADGDYGVALKGTIEPWGKWLRYNYATFDFSEVRAPGLYAISYAGHVYNPFRITEDAYAHIWQPSLDTYLAEQMDHMSIRQGYRVWSGLSHMDDARQAPPNISHFDGYSMGSHLDSPFEPGEHIPGLGVGGWQDAGDFDIQTRQNAEVVRNLVWARELFGLDWDADTVDQKARAVKIHRPDGVPDVLQQIRHGVLQLLAQYRIFGHAIVGINAPTLKVYTFIGDPHSQTDGMIYDPEMEPDENDGLRSGVPDDRWAFTTDIPANDYYVAGALAAASRVLGKLDPAMAAKAMAAAKVLWKNQQHPGDRTNRSAHSRGRVPLDVAAFRATAELVLATDGDDAVYTAKLTELLPAVEQHFPFTVTSAVRALPYMDADYRTRLASIVRKAKPGIDAEVAKTPFGVPVSMGTWGGSARVAAFGAGMHLLHKAFPGIIGPEYTLAALDYVLGRHPATNRSLVSAVGAKSQLIDYTHNRADYSFVPGAMVPGVVVIKPNFPEQMVDWPYLWYENEATVAGTSLYILLANAAIAQTNEPRSAGSRP